MGELKQKAVKGVAWNSIRSLCSTGINFIFMIFMTRLLTPDDYGMVGMLAVFTTIASAFIDCGFGQAIVRKQDRTVLDESTVYFFSIGASILCYLVIFLIAPWVGAFYEMPDLVLILRVMSLSLVVSSLYSVQALQYQIKLNFKTPSLIALSCNVFSGIVGLTLAYYGFGVWALVWQQLLSATFTAIVFIFVSEWHPIWGFSIKSFREMFAFGSNLLGARMLNIVYANISPVFIGKAYSAADLGLLSKGHSIAGFPANTIFGVLYTVSYPLLCKLQSDRKTLAEIYRRCIRVSSFVIFPVMTTLMVIGIPLMVFMFGDQWEESGKFLMLCCYPWMIVPVQSLNLCLLQVLGRSDLTLKLEIVGKILGVTMLVVCLPISIYAMCYGSIIVVSLCFFVNTHYTSDFIDLTLGQQMVDVGRSLGLSAVTGIVSYFIMTQFMSNLIQIIVGILSCIVIYLGFAFIFRMRELKELIDFVKYRE